MTRSVLPAHRPPAIVFTDLDGTLLDHNTYSFEPARPALEALRQGEVPLVLCSSKTRAEILDLQKRLDMDGPFIPENGGAVCLSGSGPFEAVLTDRLAGLPSKIFGKRYPSLREALVQLRGEWEIGLTGFGDVDLAQIVRWTGLAPDQARLAQNRDFDEPFVWEPEPDVGQVESVRSWLARRGLRLTRGGRFWHLMGSCDKGLAVRWLLNAAADLWGREPSSLGLGDSENDLSMLSEVKLGVLVERPEGGHLEPRPPGVVAVGGVGPVGWCRAVLDWLDRLGD